MSQEAVKSIVVQMLSDEDFRAKLIQDPEGTIKEGGFDVTEQEMEGFKELTNEDITNLSPEELEERLSKSTTSLTIAGSVNITSDAA
ncbi:MAG: Os1348 family NHLP clan protein [Anaerolineales bacterium]